MTGHVTVTEHSVNHHGAFIPSRVGLRRRGSGSDRITNLSSYANGEGNRRRRCQQEIA
jgi:NAD(P)-dependent dehydrogenase (short-subunit alcohol dehydrogenase family)